MLPAQKIGKAFVCALIGGLLGGSLIGCRPKHTVYVGVASSLESSMRQWTKSFTRRHPVIDIVYVSDSSSRIAGQIQHGAPYDLFIAARLDLVDQLEAEHRIHARKPLGYARLALATPITDTHQRVFDILDHSDIIAIADPSVPLGQATWQWVDAHRPRLAQEGKIRSYEGSAVAVRQRLQTGYADAAFIYEHQCLAEAEHFRCYPLEAPFYSVVATTTNTGSQPDLAAILFAELDGESLGLHLEPEDISFVKGRK